MEEDSIEIIDSGVDSNITNNELLLKRAMEDDSGEEIEGEGEDEEGLSSNDKRKRPVDKSTLSGEDLIINAPLSTKPILRNVICNIHCGETLDCLDIAMRLKSAEYNPKKFPSVTFKLTNPRTTNHIFSVGRIVSLGSKSEENGRLALRKIVRILQKLGYKKARFRDENFRIQNIMAKTNIGFPIRLEGLHYAHRKYCRFEPEIFPGLVYRMVVPHICLLIYVSGRIVFTGAKDRDEVYRAYENIYNVLLAFKQKRRSDSDVQIYSSKNIDRKNNDEDDEDDDLVLPPIPDDDEEDTMVDENQDEDEDEDEEDEDEEDVDEDEELMNEYLNEM